MSSADVAHFGDGGSFGCSQPSAARRSISGGSSQQSGMLHKPTAGYTPVSVGSRAASSNGSNLGAAHTFVPPPRIPARIRTLVEETNESFGDAEDRFLLRELLGEGSFGAVYRCSLEARDGGGADDGFEENYAVKVIDAMRIAMLLGCPVELVCPRLKREVEILQHLGEHPRILKLAFAFYSESTHRFYLVTELLTGGEVFHAIVRRRKPYNEHDGKIIFRQLVDAVAFCHNMGVAHRDLKLENCLFESEDSLNVKLCDYGQAKLLQGEEIVDTSKTLTTTPIYTAPEVLKAVEESHTYDAFKADSYGLGVVLYGLLCSALPDATKGTAYERHRQWGLLSEDARSLIQILLNPNPTARPSPQELKSHPWLKQSHSEMRTPGTSTPLHQGARSDSPNIDKRAVDSLIAVQELIVGVQRERGTALWALSCDEGENNWRWQVKYSEERLGEAVRNVRALVNAEGQSESARESDWLALSEVLDCMKKELPQMQKTIEERFAERDDIMDIDEDVGEIFQKYSDAIWRMITSQNVVLSLLRGDNQGSGQSGQLLRLKLLQMTAEQLGRERAIVSGHLARPETLRLASVVHKLAEVIGARKLLLGSCSELPTIVGDGAGLLVSLGLGDQPLLDSEELAALESFETRILQSSKRVEKPAVTDWWVNLIKIIDKLHQHIMVCISDLFAVLP